ncbi:molecular chaperone DjiA [Ponticoccus sp. SC2-23]|uniref:molecular chaperone DjiA n=1 Tax=Alexandriicola marinus TaxID=2081710 RepID=UPI000FD757C9|nr:molecular chaperone DjiA [Alexandriicola marinus]MBM1219674.1 molecular chaperone DjiA [Ponticoccus sp. SC6-9]MBM1223254.1 molecular chaperone DjiA [Ponticoccus sp. SC6-15]MBM1229487.1 molecular chaperone DjiA [Ponticoccus sp. SC6-38]MBM1232220.1 molecular chaperone DjiA [Ponticoccus sp. SC6-45]MBM1237830.1 molecular chaperone DjiA [Ponticoccus sp. SC6-49]MBM1241231.1 molecular chaperone DjiA [Ponticoccus sp. SC2-64]MBM1245744.1 molecular chaperone DjiA [Ponticoccus sp. SC6-42]MBM1250222
MSIWSRIGEALSALTAGESLTVVFDKLRSNPERSVAFTIAVIALGAKMAKADGLVTRDEVAAFREVFHISGEDEGQAARVFNLARQDIAGFEEYARRIGAMFRSAEGETPLCDLLEGLFHIAVADGKYHPAEDAFLARVAELFGFGEREFARVRSQFVPEAEADPYDVLGVSPDMETAEIRSAWRQLVRETHPDRMIARGVPEEAIKLAEKRLIAVNRAWERIAESRV